MTFKSSDFQPGCAIRHPVEPEQFYTVDLAMGGVIILRDRTIIAFDQLAGDGWEVLYGGSWYTAKALRNYLA